MELFWTPEAAQDRDEIYAYIEADNPAAALALDERLAEKAGRLLDHPGLGRPGRVAGTRECCVSCMLPGVGRRAIAPRPEVLPYRPACEMNFGFK